MTTLELNSIATGGDVNYCCVAFDHKHAVNSAALLLADTVLSRGYLWDNVRVLGGAYGCFLITTLQMKQYIVSYRDPNLEKTFENYEGIVKYLSELSLSEKDLAKLKIGAIAQRQKSLAPEQRFAYALGYFMQGVDVSAYVSLINQIVDVSLDELRGTASVYSKLLSGRKCVVGKAPDVKRFVGDG